MVKRQKTETIVAKRRRTRGKISWSSKKKDKGNTRDNIDPNQANNKYLLIPQL